MTDLSDVMGEEFAEKYEETNESRRQERRKVPQDEMMEICYQAVHGGGFDSEEPRFTFEGETTDHDVVLMESPRQDIGKFKHEIGNDGSISLGMFHLGQLWSCIFNEEMVGMVDKIKEDEYYIVVGRYKENIRNAGTEEEQKYYNIAPVRGIVPISLARQYADEYKDQLEGADAETQAEEQAKEGNSGSDDDSTGVDLSGVDDNQVDKEKVVKVFKAIAGKAESVIEQTAAGDSDAIDKLVTTTNNNLDNEADRERILDIFEEEVDEIEGRGEEDDGDDELDLGGIDDSDSDDDTETSDDASDSDDDSSESENAEDWF